MHWFQYKNGVLNGDDVPLPDVAERFGTPSFVYSRATIDRHIATIDGAFRDIDHLTCYSLKANSCGTLLRILAEHGLGADIVSGGELYRALRAGIPAERIVYSGVGKTEAEIRYALESGILALNIESESELHTVNRIAGTMKLRAPVSFRINPDVDPKTHPYISTGLKKNKFGIPHSEALQIYREAAAMPDIEIVGIDAHIGSQLIDVSPYREAAGKIVSLIDEIRGLDIDLKFVDIGGGLGIRYEDENPPDPGEWAAMIIPVLKKTGCRLIIEPGRSLIGNAGVLLTRVLYIKTSGDKTFVIVDAGMNDIVRPSLYGAFHDIIPVHDIKGERRTVDVVGPICESGDFIAKDRLMCMPSEGDLLAVMSAGAYGMSMSSNYNSRLRAAEVMVHNDTAELVTSRETYEDLVAREKF
ncbi:diaminopimelate decarboxylase [bacterium]|nr:diaminopimelate decarboxylase [bacterium]